MQRQRTCRRNQPRCECEGEKRASCLHSQDGLMVRCSASTTMLVAVVAIAAVCAVCAAAGKCRAACAVVCKKSHCRQQRHTATMVEAAKIKLDWGRSGRDDRVDLPMCLGSRSKMRSRDGGAWSVVGGFASRVDLLEGAGRTLVLSHVGVRTASRQAGRLAGGLSGYQAVRSGGLAAGSVEAPRLCSRLLDVLRPRTRCGAKTRDGMADATAN